MAHKDWLPSPRRVTVVTLFSELDSRAAELGVASYGISVTTLEEVFLKVGHGDDADEWRRPVFDRQLSAASKVQYRVSGAIAARRDRPTTRDELETRALT